MRRPRCSAMRASSTRPRSSNAGIAGLQERGYTDRMTHYPRPIDDDVYFCGFSSEKSYGAQSYFIRHPDGNWMTDAPRFVPELAARIEELGGLRRIFLTHRDDVADADLYARRFGARRIIHEADLDAEPAAEVVLRGSAPS